MSLPWFRLYSEDLRKPPLATMPAADRWDFIRLLGIANEETMRGWLPEVKDIAFLMRMSEAKVIGLLHRLMAMRLVEQDQDAKRYAIVNRKRFFPRGDDSSDRVRRHRQRNGGGNGESNGVSSRDSHALDIERDQIDSYGVSEEDEELEEDEDDLISPAEASDSFQASCQDLIDGFWDDYVGDILGLWSNQDARSRRQLLKLARQMDADTVEHTFIEAINVTTPESPALLVMMLEQHQQGCGHGWRRGDPYVPSGWQVPVRREIA